RLHWRPASGAGASEATNSLGSTEEALLWMLGGHSGERDRAAEFAVSGEAGQTAAAIEARWASLRERIPAALAALDAATLEGSYQHSRRGSELGRKVLHGTATHVALHVGHAQLTRDLLPVD
ncbi:MAG: hypothetical protein O2895_04465, partial [Chloroflexi bacterium]|nr:hypothetical protein [Chloroflexota bacterium]